MKKVLFLIALCASSSWATFSGYTYRREVSIEQENVSTQSLTYTNFPVLLSTTDVTLSTASVGGHMQTPYDLVFSTMQDCSFLLNWDTETVNNTGSSALNVWVTVPAISSNTDTPFFMCYGNSGTTSYQGNSTKVWDSNYGIVAHLGNGTTLNAADSTSNANPVTLSPTPPTATTGEVDGGMAALKASNEGVSYGAATAVNGYTTYTVELWENQSNSASDNCIFTKGSPFANGHILRLRAPANTPQLLVHWTSGSVTFQGPTISSNTLHHLAYSYNTTSTANVPAFYYDGVLESVSGGPPTGTYTVDTNAFNVNLSSSSLGSFGGTLDEFRYSNIVRSYGWIQTEYNNQFSPSTFAEIGPETQVGVSGTPLLQINGGQLLIRGGKVLVQ